MADNRVVRHRHRLPCAMIGFVSKVGYSGKPLAEKLGVKPGTTIHAIAAPDNYAELLGAVDGLTIEQERPANSSFIHVFVRSRAELAEAEDLVGALEPGGTLWVSWPKKSSAPT